MWVHPKDRKPIVKSPAKLFNNKQWQICYENWIGSLKPSTAETYMYICEQFFTDPRLRPDQITQAQVWEFLHSKCGPGRSKGADPAVNTQISRLNALKSFYTFASAYDVTYRTTTRPIMTHRPPTHKIKLPEAPEQDRHMSDEELRRFFAVIPHDTIAGKRDRALFCTFFWTSRRLNEIRTLTWNDIKQDAVFADGSCGIQYFWTGKGRATKSSAELPEPAWLAIVDYLKASGRWERMQPNTPLFVAHDESAGYREETCLHKTSIDTIFRKYIKAAGLHNHGGLHCFRHTQAAITFAESGNNILAVMEKLGHKNSQISWRYVRNVSLRRDTIAQQIRSRYSDL